MPMTTDFSLQQGGPHLPAAVDTGRAGPDHQWVVGAWPLPLALRSCHIPSLGSTLQPLLPSPPCTLLALTLRTRTAHTYYEDL